MRKKNVAKRLGIASLCLGTCLSAFSGTALLSNDVALAIGNRNGDPFSIVSSNSLHTTLTYQHDTYWYNHRENTYTLCEPTGGIRLSSDAPYEETLNGVFQGDTTLQFTFPETFDWESKWYGGDFKIRVSDAENETDYFDVVYYPKVRVEENANRTIRLANMAIEYKGIVRTLKSNGQGIATTCSSDGFIGAPAFLTHYQNNNSEPTGMSTTPGKLTLDWDDSGVLSVLTNSCALGAGAKSYTLATFDGSYDTMEPNDGIVWDSTTQQPVSFGLPKLSFKNGYKISLLSDFTIEGVDDHATDVCIQEITTNGKTTKYTNKNTETITILDRGNDYKSVEVGDELTIPMAIYGDNQEVIDVQVVRPNGTRSSVTPGEAYKVKTKGVHHVTYCVQTDATNESLAAFSFTAKDESTTIETSDFVHTSGNATQDKNGLRISSNEAYKATFKAIFTGDTTLKFAFPETFADSYYGDFNIRITDVNDNNNYFDIKYYVSNSDKNYTGIYVQHGDEVRLCRQDGTAWYDIIQENTDAIAYAPSFLSYCGASGEFDGNRIGALSLVWTDDVLAVQANTGTDGDETAMRTIAKFDGTSGFLNDGTSFGLPKVSFANGYTITVSSSISNATDVCFQSIENGGETYDFSNKQLAKDAAIEDFANTFKTLETMQTVVGKVFLGWKNTTTNELYPAYSIVKKVSGQSYQPVIMIFDTVNGASIRMDTSEGGKSGIRFQSYFSVDEFEAYKGYIQSFGTLIAYTDALTNGDFTIENYQGSSTFAQVENTKGTFEYIDKSGETYKAYSMALVNIVDYAKEYSARGYLVVTYADGTTQNIYTDYNATDNTGCVADLANQIKTKNVDMYALMSDAQKALIDAYANAYVKKEN